MRGGAWPGMPERNLGKGAKAVKEGKILSQNSKSFNVRRIAIAF